MPKDLDKARMWLEKAAAQGSADARYHLGALHEKGAQKDVHKTIEHYTRAAAQGQKDAEKRLEIMRKSWRFRRFFR